MTYEADPSAEDARKTLYIKSHGRYNAGEQRTRGYVWDHASPVTTRFGTTPIPRGRGEQTAQVGVVCIINA